jgi:drug/metabolite transporter (DMT)-like permease
MTINEQPRAPHHYRGALYLLITSLVWGFAFVPQRLASAHVEAHTFNAIKYLGATVLMLSIFWRTLRRHLRTTSSGQMLLLGFLLFAGSALQQIGVASTTAGKAGFITGLYMVFTPILLMTFWRTRISLRCWIGAVIAVFGLVLLCINEQLTIDGGDLWVLCSALMFSLLVIYGDRFVATNDPITLATGQYFFCGIFCSLALVLRERPTVSAIQEAAPSLAYMIFFSTGIGYTLALVGQRYVRPEIAALIMALEAVFAALAGWLVLDEHLNTQQGIGCAFMLLGCLIAQQSSTRATPATQEQ